MRVWDIAPQRLCRSHLLGEHREIHCIYKVIVDGKKGYSKHPETLRWVGRLNALVLRHDLVVEEMQRRGYKHHTPLECVDGDSSLQEEYVDLPAEQIALLKAKGCGCNV